MKRPPGKVEHARHPAEKILGHGVGRHLAGAAADAILEFMTLVNAWEVTLDPDGRPQWRDSTHQRHHQPARGPAQRLADLAFRMLPIEAYI